MFESMEELTRVPDRDLPTTTRDEHGWISDWGSTKKSEPETAPAASLAAAAPPPPDRAPPATGPAPTHQHTDTHRRAA